jgi:hypothetical protein
MRYAWSWGLSFLGAVLLGTSGCAHNTYDIASRSPSELKVVSDADLCYAQRYWTSPSLRDEIALRRLDCRTGNRLPPPKVVTKKPKKSSQPPAGVAVGTVAKPDPSSADRAPVDLDAVAPRPQGAGGDGGAVDLDAAGE